MRTALAAVVATLLASTAFAQDALQQSMDKAKEKVGLERAKTLYAEGDWERSAREYEGLIATNKDPDLLFRLGESYKNLGDYRKAVQTYTRYLSENPNAVNASEVNKLIVELTPLTFKGAPPPKNDGFPPRIKHEPRQTWPRDETIVIDVHVDDHTGVFEPMLYYRLGAAGAFVPTELRPGGDNKYVGLVAPMNPGTLEYFLEAFDTKGNGPTRNGTPTWPHVLKIVEPGAKPTSDGIAAIEPPLPPVGVPLPGLATEVTGEAGGSLVLRPVDSGRRGPWAYVAMGAGGVAAIAASYFGMRTMGLAGDWRAARAEQDRVAFRDQAQSSATMANVTWTASALLLAGGGALFFFTNF